MAWLLGGLLLVGVGGTLFWRCLPRDGQPYRLANTIWEPYVSVAFTGAAVLGVSMTVAGVIQLIS
jgi:hypothetical protein